MPRLTIHATAPEEPTTSDNDGGERPVRRKLRETTITSAQRNTSDTTESRAEDAEDDSSRDSSRGRKRALDDDQNEKKDGYSESSNGSNHRRKRSRELNTEDAAKGEGAAQEEKGQSADDAAGKILSPKKKRSRDQVDKDEPKAEGEAEKSENRESAENRPSPAKGEPEKKRHRDDSKERDAAESKVCLSLSWRRLVLICFARLRLQVHSLILRAYRRLARLDLPNRRRLRETKIRSPPLLLLPLRRQVWPLSLLRSNRLLAPLAPLLVRCSRSPLGLQGPRSPRVLPRRPVHLLSRQQGLLGLRL